LHDKAADAHAVIRVRRLEHSPDTKSPTVYSLGHAAVARLLNTNDIIVETSYDAAALLLYGRQHRLDLTFTARL
jgi:hypothetical protein